MSIDPERLGLVGVLKGGASSERAISLKSGEAVEAALRRAGCRTVGMDLMKAEAEALRDLLDAHRPEVVFIALHGTFGEDGTVQEILEQAAIPYTGSGVRASRIAIDKAATHQALEEMGIPLPDYRLVDSAEDLPVEGLLAGLGGTVVVKPPREGSSLGVRIVHRPEELPSAVAEALRFGGPVLIERYIDGRELTAGMVGGEVLPLVEIRPREAFFDFTAKYEKGRTEYLVPAPVDTETVRRVGDWARRVSAIVGLRDLARLDFRVDPEGRPYLLEINTIPGFTETSLLPMAARSAGWEFERLCVEIVAWARSRALPRNGAMVSG